MEDAISTTARPTHVVSPTLAAALKEAEASSRLEGIEPNDNPIYQDVKRRLLADEITLEEGIEIYDIAFDENSTER